MPEAEIETVNNLSKIYRQRLFDISWFMRLLNEYIARQANKEDNCTGHFWEGRFKSQALMDEAALAACMAYVDLNPVRVCLAKTPEASAHTSIRRRINAAKRHRQPYPLLSFTGNQSNTMTGGLPFCAEDYFALVDETGRRLHPNKRGKIDEPTSPILTRIGLNQNDWDILVAGIEKEFKAVISLDKLITKRRRSVNHT